MGEELVVTTAPADDQSSTVHVEQVTKNESKSRYSINENGDKKASSDNENAIFRKLEEVS